MIHTYSEICNKECAWCAKGVGLGPDGSHLDDDGSANWRLGRVCTAPSRDVVIDRLTTELTTANETIGRLRTALDSVVTYIQKRSDEIGTWALAESNKGRRGSEIYFRNCGASVAMSNLANEIGSFIINKALADAPHAIKTRNSEALESFTDYCRRNPEERFWQALRNWSKLSFIFSSDDPNGFGCQDTFHLEWLEGIPVVSPEPKADVTHKISQVPHDTRPIQVWVDVDLGIADVVIYLNTIPGVRTLASCQGTIGEGGPDPYRPQVMATWTDEAFARLSAEFDISYPSEGCVNWGYLHPKAEAPVCGTCGGTKRVTPPVYMSCASVPCPDCQPAKERT